MRHIVIRNLGPLAEADVFLNKINIIVGPQSAGKSCLLKSKQSVNPVKSQP